jgi:hypothetical protein
VLTPLVLGLVTLAGATTQGSCERVTEIVVVVDGDLGSDIDTIVLRVESPGFTADKTARVADTKLPLTLGVAGGSDPSARIVVRATALRDKAVVLERTASAALAPEESRMLYLTLCKTCRGVACGPGTTCGAGKCEPIGRTALPAWNGEPPRGNPCTSTAGDGGVDDDGGIEPEFHELTDTRWWSKIDLATIDPGLRGYAGAAFDGKYIYLAPWALGPTTHGRVARYDVNAPFDAKTSWTFVDLEKLAPNAKGYVGAAVAGVYVYFAPFHNPGGTSHAFVARHDTRKDFATADGWSFHDLRTSSQTRDAGGFGGIVLDDSYLYFIARDTQRTLARHTRNTTFLDGGWGQFETAFDASTGGRGEGYYGGASDGTYVYLAPSGGALNLHGVVARHSGVPLSTGWETFDLTTIDPALRGYIGVVFDRSFFYFVPYENVVGAKHGNVMRYDKTKPFADTNSWTRFDTTTVAVAAKGFVGGVFDGRFVYFIPYDSASGLYLTRYDTTLPFGEKTSWSTFDMTTLGGGVRRFNGGAFDGKYVYFVPYDGGPVVRFDARKTRTLLDTARGSFL